MNDCLLYIKIKIAAVFLSFHIKQNQALSVSPHYDTVSHIFIIPHESLKDCFLCKKKKKKKRLQNLFVLSTLHRSCNSCESAREPSGNETPLTCSGYAAALVEWPRFNWLHTSGLGALWDYKGHRWEWGSGVQWLASDPVHSVIREPYREAPYTSDFQSCVNVWAEHWEKSSDVLRVIWKILLCVCTLFPARASWREEKEKRERRDEAERQKKKRRLPAASISIARLRLLKSAYLSQITLAVAYTFISAVSSSRMT